MIDVNDYGGEFGFTSGRTPDFRGNKGVYQVYLPHSCDEWEITCEEDKATAVQKMRKFVDEAKRALRVLELSP